jgi:hypothetical protein
MILIVNNKNMKNKDFIKKTCLIYTVVTAFAFIFFPKLIGNIYFLIIYLVVNLILLYFVFLNKNKE